jgi:DHA2 family multidrug resistance protein-like MFS transporter
LWLIRGTPESRTPSAGAYRFDLAGVLAFMVAMLALLRLVLQGSGWGWGSPAALGLAAITVVAAVAFYNIETRKRDGFVDLGLFRNRTYTGATLSNFLINATVGMQLVSLQLVQMGGGMSAQQAGLLTLGYAIAIIAFIRVGEKLLQRFGPRKPMVWGCAIPASPSSC